MNEYITFFPAGDVTLRQANNLEEQRGNIGLRNTSDVIVGFKFRCSNNTDVVVSPVTGLIEPAEEKSVHIIYVDRDNVVKRPEVLQVLVAPLDDRFEDDRCVGYLISRTHPDEIQEHRFFLRHRGALPKSAYKDVTPFEVKPGPVPPLGQHPSKTELKPSDAVLVVTEKSALIVDDSGNETQEKVEGILLEDGMGTALVTASASMCTVRGEEEVDHHSLENPETSPSPKVHPGNAQVSDSQLASHLYQRFSSVETLLEELSEQNSHANWFHRQSTILFCIVVVLGLIMAYFVIPGPAFWSWSRFWSWSWPRSRPKPNILSMTAEEIGETYFETRPGVSLDEIICNGLRNDGPNI